MPTKRATKKKTSPANKPGKKPARRPAKKAAGGKKVAPGSKPAPRKRAQAAARPPVAAAAPPPPRAASRRRARKPSGAEGHLSYLDRLIAMMVEREVVEVEFEDVGTRWRVRRAEPQTVTYAAAPAIPLQVASPFGGGMAAAPGAAEAEAEVQGEVFKSPMVGTFYRAGSPDAEPFSKPGDKVSADRTLCIIEAMKVMNEIKAEREFEILDVLVKNGESVEFGQPLFLIR